MSCIHHPPALLARPLLALAAAILLMLPNTRSALALPGDPDPAFGQDGRVRLGFADGHDGANAVAMQSDGRFVVAGFGYNGGWSAMHGVVVRYNSDGTIDPTFGDGGVAWHFADPGTIFSVDAIAIQPDGKILVGGYRNDSYTTQMFVARLTSNGTLDPTFGYDGVPDLGYAPGAVQALVVLADGRILLAGNSGPTGRHIAVMRLHSTGTRDGTFGSYGIATTPIQDFGTAYALVVVNGKYLAIGSAIQNTPSSSAIALVQFNDNGTLDIAFSGDGIATTYVGSQAKGRAVALQTSQTQPTKIVVAGEGNNGSAYSQFVILRYLLDGSLDTTFDSDRYVVPYLSSYSCGARGVRIQVRRQPVADHCRGYSQTAYGAWTSEFALVKVNLAGTLDGAFDGDGIVKTNLGPDGGVINAMLLSGGITVFGMAGGHYEDADVVLARYSATGALDPAFDGDGVRVDDFGRVWSEAGDVAVQPDGRIVLAGLVIRNGSSEFAAARFLTDGTPDSSFAGNGRLEFPAGEYGSEAKAVLIQADERIVLGGAATGFGAGDNGFALSRHMADGTADPGFGDNGIVVTPRYIDGTVTDLLQQSDGKLIAAGLYFDLYGAYAALARYHTDGRIDSTFGTDGTGLWSSFAQGYEDPLGPAVAFQPDGRIVLACEYGVSLPSRDVLSPPVHRRRDHRFVVRNERLRLHRYRPRPGHGPGNRHSPRRPDRGGRLD